MLRGRHWRALCPVRAALCAKLAWLGVQLDERGNTSGGPCISTADSGQRTADSGQRTADSGVSLWVIPPNEELMIAQHTLALVRP